MLASKRAEVGSMRVVRMEVVGVSVAMISYPTAPKTGRSGNPSCECYVNLARREVQTDSSACDYSAGMNAGTNEFHDLIHGGAGLEDGGDTRFLQRIYVLVGDNSAEDQQHIVHLVLLEQIHYTGNDRIVRTRKNREPDDVDVFLQRGINDHFGSLAQAGVDDFHSGVAKGAGYHFCAAVMTVEAG